MGQLQTTFWWATPAVARSTSKYTRPAAARQLFSHPVQLVPAPTFCASYSPPQLRTAVGATCALPTKAPDGQSTTMGRLWVRCRPIALWKMSSCARTILEEATGTWTGSCKENYLSFKFTTVYSQLLKWLLLSCTTVYFTSTHPCAYFSVRKGIIFFV